MRTNKVLKYLFSGSYHTISSEKFGYFLILLIAFLFLVGLCIWIKLKLIIRKEDNLINLPTDQFEKFKKMYFDFQYAWSKNDISTLKDQLTPGIYDLFQKDINRYKRLNKRNYLEEIELIDIKQDGEMLIAPNLETRQQSQFLTLVVYGKMRDFVADENDPNDIEEKRKESYVSRFSEYWIFTREKES